jgi:hypothetical protein
MRGRQRVGPILVRNRELSLSISTTLVSSSSSDWSEAFVTSPIASEVTSSSSTALGSSTDEPQPDFPKLTSSPGTIAGAVVGALVGAALLCGIAVVLYRRNKKLRQRLGRSQSPPQGTNSEAGEISQVTVQADLPEWIGDRKS